MAYKINKSIEVIRLSKHYDNIIALKEVSFSFKNGKMYSIMGPSGAGKTSFLNIIAMLDQQSFGEIIINDKNISHLSDDEKADMRNLNIGFVFQSFNLLSNLNAKDNVAIPMYVRKEMKLEDINNQSEKMLTSFGLMDRMYHYPRDLSAGEKQRVAIARALINNPNIILADEPTGNLDEDNEKIIMSKLRSLADSGKTVIVVSHNPIVKEYSHVNINMSHGEVISIDYE